MNMKVTHNNHYLEKEQKLKDLKFEEQFNELKKIIPEQSFGKRRIENGLFDEIRIIDRRYSSMASSMLDFFCVRYGMNMARLDPLNGTIKIKDRSLFNILKKFGEKWGYKNIETEYQV